MWVAARAVVVWVFGDDLVKIALYIVVGFVVLAYVEASAATAAIMSQAWGQWWLAGVGGGAQQATQTMPQPASPLGSARVPVPTVAALSGITLDRASTIIANAMTWLGVRYLWGGCTHSGVDCSCFVQNALRAAGVSGVPRTTVDQIRWTHPVSRSQLQATDLVYFDNTCTGCGANPTHVGMYLGDGRMIDAGDPVQIESIDTPYWRAHWDSAGRIP